MGFVFLLALIGAVVAFIPGASVILIPMEIFMVYKIANSHNAFELGLFIAMSVGIVTISVTLKGLALLLDIIPVVGEIANSLVAFMFIVCLGFIAETYYRGKARP